MASLSKQPNIITLHETQLPVTEAEPHSRSLIHLKVPSQNVFSVFIYNREILLKEICEQLLGLGSCGSVSSELRVTST